MEAGVNGLQQLFQGLPQQPLRGLFPLSRTKAATPEERRRLKEERRKDRLEKKSARLKPAPLYRVGHVTNRSVSHLPE